MDAPYGLRGHTSSMSSLLTILPLSLDAPDWPLSSRLTSGLHASDLGEASLVPLPPSAPESEHDGFARDTEKEPVLEMAPIDIPDELRVPLPPSPLESEHGHGLGVSGEDEGPLHTCSGDLTVLTSPSTARPPSLVVVPIGLESEPATPCMPETISELMSIVRRTANERSQVLAMRIEAIETLHACAANHRLVSLQSDLYKRMIEAFRLERKNSFGSLLTLSDRLEAETSSTSRLSGDGRKLEDLIPRPGSRIEIPWLNSLPSRSQSAILKLLNSLRNNPVFLADRLSYLTVSQLTALAKPHRHLTSTESLGETSSPLARLNPRHNRKQRKEVVVIPTMEELSRDPLRLLALSCFSSNAHANSKEKSRQLDAWSTACARVFEDPRPGTNEFCLAALDVFAESTTWALRPKLELFLQEVMYSGAKFLASPSSAADEISRVGSESRQTSSAAADFFNEAVQSLLTLILSIPGGAGIPSSALSLIRATMAKFGESAGGTKAWASFALEWYCKSFLAKVLFFPERHQIMLKTHVSARVRGKLYLELAYRLRDLVSDFSASRLSPTGPIHNLFEKLVATFGVSLDGAGSCSHYAFVDEDRLFTILYAEDILCITKALYPDNSPNPDQFSKTGVFSTASSVTGSSTLTGGTHEGGFGAISSFTPSVSGTSVTSHTFSNESFIQSGDGNTAGSTALPVTPLRSRPATAGGLSPSSKTVPIQDFLPDLWKMCSSRKSSSSRNQNAEAAIFYIDDGDGHLSFRTSHSQHGDIDLQTIPLDPAYNEHVSEGTATILQALSRCSLDRNSQIRGNGSSPSSMARSVKALFEYQLATSKSAHDFQSAHQWFRALQTTLSLGDKFQKSVLPDIVLRLSASYTDSHSKFDSYQQWLHALQCQRRAQVQQAKNLKQSILTLKTKMWYITDVRHSSPYEHASNVAVALRSMQEETPAKKHGVTAWAKQRFRASFGQDRTEAHFLELLSAPKNRGGPNKLTDEQAEITSRWLTQESIENFCRGEERMHRFCLEIRKCAASLVGHSMLESPVLWSSTLFQTQSANYRGPIMHDRNGNPVSSRTFGTQDSFLGLGEVVGSSPRGLGFSLEQQSSKGPTLNMASSLQPPFEPNFMREPQLNRSNGAYNTASRATNVCDGPKIDTEELRQTVVSLLISDLGYDLWGKGSETDIWLNENKRRVVDASRKLAETTFQVGGVEDWTLSSAPVIDAASQPREADQSCEAAQTPTHEQDMMMDNSPSFDFAEGYEKLLKTFKLSSNPTEKLQALYELSLLAECQCSCIPMKDRSSQGHYRGETSIFAKYSSYDQRTSRIRLTRLEEVVANCEERRRSSIASSSEPRAVGENPAYTFGGNSSAYDISNALVLVGSLFVDKHYKPETLFRDLQLIASFVPSSVLDHTSKGTVFWTVGLVAMSLKAETCKLMTYQANEIVNYHLNSSNHREPIRNEQGSRTAENQATRHMQMDELESSELADAARLYMLSALEGEPAAARELGLFYLTHPELVRHVMLPLSKPGEISKTAAGATSERRGERAGVLDPQTFAIAYHWMEFAANAGDADAQTFLRENVDLGQGL